MSATTGKLAAAVVAGVCLVGSVTAAPANAYSDSQSTKFDNGARLTANIWASNLGGWKGCHDFKSSAVSTMKPKWIEDDFNAHATGINVSLKGAGASFNGAMLVQRSRITGGKRVHIFQAEYAPELLLFLSALRQQQRHLRTVTSALLMPVCEHRLEF